MRRLRWACCQNVPQQLLTPALLTPASCITPHRAAGNADGAKIYAQNAIRKKNEALNYLRLGSRLDAVVSRLDQQAKMQVGAARWRVGVWCVGSTVVKCPHLGSRRVCWSPAGPAGQDAGGWVLAAVPRRAKGCVGGWLAGGWLAGMAGWLAG